MKKLLFIFIITNLVLQAQLYDRNVLIEIFTNSHCPLCPAAHTTLESYLSGVTDQSRIKFIYYHMSFPYPDDLLNQANTADAQARNNFYGPFSGTPRGIFDGETQGNNYGAWFTTLDEKLGNKSYADINLTGSRDGSTVKLTAEIQMDQDTPQGDLAIHFIVTENVVYQGRNGISDHKNVMRKMITGGEGQSISVIPDQQIEKTIILENDWIPDNSAILVFVQDRQSKAVYQSQFISYNDLVITSLDVDPNVPIQFNLSQNYPNPFNPSTTIRYEIPNIAGIETTEPVVSITNMMVSLRIYDILGNEIKTLVNQKQNPGRYEVEFDAGDLPSGVYFYRLTADKFIKTKRLVLLK